MHWPVMKGDQKPFQGDDGRKNVQSASERERRCNEISRSAKSFCSRDCFRTMLCHGKVAQPSAINAALLRIPRIGSIMRNSSADCCLSTTSKEFGYTSVLVAGEFLKSFII